MDFFAFYLHVRVNRSSGDRFQHKAPGERRENMTPMRLWDQGKVLKRVVVFRSIPQPMSSFKSETSRFKSGTDKLVDRSPAGRKKV